MYGRCACRREIIEKGVGGIEVMVGLLLPATLVVCLTPRLVCNTLGLFWMCRKQFEEHQNKIELYGSSLGIFFILSPYKAFGVPFRACG
jgi:hypothetical protein